MLKAVRKFFAPPVFLEDEDKTRKAKYANAIAIAFFAVVIVYETIIRLFLSYSAFSILDLFVFGVAIICGAGLLLLRKGYVKFASVLLVVMTWMASNSISATGFGVRDSSYVINFAIVLMAGLLLGWQASLITTVISIFAGFGLAYAETNGLINVPPYPVTSFAQDMTFVFGLNAVLIYLLINGLENALRKSRRNLEELESANVSLNYTQTELQNRSADLLTANEQLENRTKKLQAVAEITRTAAALQRFDDLLTTITQIISSQLGYYHVGIFLLDEERQYAILRSANTESGSKMIESGYRLPVGQLGVVSSVAQTGQPRIALNEGRQNPSSTNPDLNETQSQLALPLKSGDEVIGVLDIQSAKTNDFTEDDLSTLSILADQVGISLQNALIFEESQRALREANAESLRASKQDWRSFEETLQTRGYRYDGIKSEPLKDAKQLGRENDSVVIPVQLRGQTIGRLRLSAPDNRREWTDDELGIVQATAERVALALEGARLLDGAQKRASREAFLSDVAAKLSTSFQLDSILRDTVQELGQTLTNSTVTFQLVNPSQDGLETQRPNGASAE